jgi:hypothetical protein
MVVEQVIYFIAVNFIHRNSNCKVALIVLPVVNAALKQVLNGKTLQPLHGVSFPGTSLTVSEDCNRASVEHIVQYRAQRVFVKLLSALDAAKSVIKLKVLIFNKLRDSVDFVPALVNRKHWVGN